jgi:hypothetical protein
MSKIRHIGGFAILLVIGVGLAAAGTGISPFSFDGGSPVQPPTDSTTAYDNGVMGSWVVIGASGPNYFPHWAVAFDQGVATIDSLKIYLKNEAAHNDAVHFRVYSNNGGIPGPALYTTGTVFLNQDSVGHWYSVACSVPVNGRFFVGESAYSSSAGHLYQAWDNNGDNAPALTQYQTNSSGAWVQDSHTGDLMIRVHCKTHNVGCTQILAPTGTIDSNSLVTPIAEVRNFGDYLESYWVKMRIGSFYNDSHQVYFQNPGATQQEYFTPRTVTAPPGVYTVACSTRLAGDVNAADNWKTGTVTIQRPQNDVGTVAIVAPLGSVNLGDMVTPACSVKNYSGLSATYSVLMKIGSYSNSANVTAQPPGNTRYVTFPTWTASSPGLQAITCSTQLAGDIVPSNDRRTGSVNVLSGDVGVTRILAPLGLLDSNTSYTPACSVYNFGTATVNYSVLMKIGSGPTPFYNNTLTVNNHAPGTRLYITFPPFAAWPRGTGCPVTCTTRLGGDMNTANDRQTASVDCQVLDAQVVALLAPSGPFDSGATASPQATIRNNGSVQSTFDATFRIGNWSNTKSVTLAAGGSQGVTFDVWTALERAKQVTRCTTSLAGDCASGNNVRSDSVFVNVHDAGVQSVIAPAGHVAPGLTTPRAMLRNFGTRREAANAVFRINEATPPYLATVSLPAGLPVGQDTLVSFSNWTAEIGAYTAICSTYQSGDQVAGNDTRSVPVVVALPDVGWTAKPDVPAGPKGKNVKDGGCLASSVEHGVPFIYALKGNNRLEFYKFGVYTTAWDAKETIPAIGSSGKKKMVKKGASLIASDGKVYATKGNGTLEFWSYDPELSGSGTYPWISLADVPAGAKTVKEGAGLAAVTISDTAFVYFLKGSGTMEFLRYNTVTNVWSPMADAPGGLSGRAYKNGSCLVYDPDQNYIYALKGSLNEMAFYQVDANAWGASSPLPLAGSSGKKKKAKDGAGLAYYNKTIYALKGGNTTEFWSYRTDSAVWTQQPDMPPGTGKRVKGGGSLVAVANDLDQGATLYALKGNNTLEFYDYPVSDVYAGRLPLTASHSSVLSNSALRAPHAALTVAPNPFTSATAIVYTLPKSGVVTLKLYDVSGKLVTTLAAGRSEAGRHTLIPAANVLSKGIYMVKLETADAAMSAKLIVE